jgi:hypothetical protein
LGDFLWETTGKRERASYRDLAVGVTKFVDPKKRAAFGPPFFAARGVTNVTSPRARIKMYSI